MTALATLAAVGVAAAFAGIGGLVLGRCPRGVSGWNEAFLAGGAVASLALLAFSVTLGPLALPVLAAGVAAVGLPAFGLAVRRFARARDRAACSGKPGAPEALLAAWVAIAFLAFGVANFRYNLLWDGMQIWATKAMLLVDGGRLSPVLWTAQDLEGRVGRVAAYPPLVPLLEALVATARGSFDFDAVKPVFLLFYASLLAGTWAAGRSLGGRRAGLLAAALVAALPPLSTGWAAGGYADMPQAAALVALVGALLRGDREGPAWRRPAPWLLGAVVSVKSEGTILALVAVGACAAAAAFPGGLRVVATAARREAGGIVVVGGFLTQRAAYAAWTAFPWALDYRPVDAGSLLAASGRFPEVAGLVLAEMANVGKWGLLWPALAVAVVLLARGGGRLRLLASSTALAVALYASVFLFTNWPLALHVRTALDRVLSQLAPVAVLVVLAALLPGETTAPAPPRTGASVASPGTE